MLPLQSFVWGNVVHCHTHTPTQTHINETRIWYTDIPQIFFPSYVYTFSTTHAPYFHVIKLFSGTNYNYALLKIIKKSCHAPQLWKNLLPACFSNLHHWFWWCLKWMGCISAWGGVCEGAGRKWRFPPSIDVQASDFIYMCLSALLVVGMCFRVIFIYLFVYSYIGYLLKLWEGVRKVR